MGRALKLMVFEFLVYTKQVCKDEEKENFEHNFRQQLSLKVSK